MLARCHRLGYSYHMIDTAIRRKLEPVLDALVEARWLHRYWYEDGVGFRLEWEPEGDSRAEEVKALAKLSDLKAGSGNFIPIPAELAETLIWKQIVSQAQGARRRFTDYEEKVLFHVLAYLHH
jgi:hypothetical protein